MKVIEFLEKANKTLFSYEIIPPLRGGSIEKIFNLVEKLKPFDREPWIQRIAQTHWTLDEVKEGIAWEHLRNYVK